MPFIPLSNLSEEEKQQYLSRQSSIVQPKTSAETSSQAGQAGQEAYQEAQMPDYSQRNNSGEVGLGSHLFAGAQQASNAFNQSGGMGNVGSNLWDAAKFIPQAIGNTVQGAWNGISDFGKGVGNIAQGIGNAVTNQNGEQGWNNAMDQISKGSAQGIHGVAETISSQFMGTTNALPNAIKSPLNAIGGFLSGFSDSLASTALDASGNLGANIGGQKLMSNNDLGQQARSILQDIATIAMSKSGNEQAISAIKLQPLLLGKVSNSFGDLGGPWGHLQKGVNTINSAMDNPTAALNSAVQGFKKAAGNIGKETDIPNSWASPSLIKYNPENARNFLGSMRDQGMFTDVGSSTVESTKPQIEQYIMDTANTISKKLQTGTYTPSDIASIPQDLSTHVDSIFKGMSASMSGTPIIADSLVHFLGQTAEGLQHAGNQGELATLTKGIISQFNKTPTFGGILDSYNQLGNMIENNHPALQGQTDFAQQLHGELRNALSSTIQHASPEAAGALQALQTTAENLKSTLIDVVHNEVARLTVQGKDINEALLSVAQDKLGNAQYVPSELQQSIDKAYIQNIISKSIEDGKLDYRKLAEQASLALKVKGIASDTAQFTADFMKNTAVKAQQMLDKGTLSAEKLADKVFDNPTPENIQLFSSSTGVHSPTDTVNILGQSDPALSGLLLDQLAIAKVIGNSRLADTRPESIVGKKLTDIASFLIDKKNQVGVKKGELITKNADKSIDITQARNNIMDFLAEQGIIKGEDGTLDFSNSSLKNDKPSRTFIQNAVKEIEKQNPTIKQVDVSRQTILNDMKNAKGVQGFTSEPIKTSGEFIRAQLSQAIEDKLPGYRELNKNFVTTMKALQPFLKAIGVDTDVGQLSVKDLRAGEIANRLAGNASSITRDKIQPMIDMYTKFTGKSALPDIQQLISHSSLLKDLFGDSQSNNLRNSVKSGMRAAQKSSSDAIDGAKSIAGEAMKLNPVGLALETGKAVFKALNKEPEVNNLNFAQRAHEALLKRVHERNVKNAK